MTEWWGQATADHCICKLVTSQRHTHTHKDERNLAQIFNKYCNRWRRHSPPILFFAFPEMCIQTADGWGFFLLAKREVDPTPTIILQILDIPCPPTIYLLGPYHLSILALSPSVRISGAHTRSIDAHSPRIGPSHLVIIRGGIALAQRQFQILSASLCPDLILLWSHSLVPPVDGPPLLRTQHLRSFINLFY